MFLHLEKNICIMYTKILLYFANINTDPPFPSKRVKLKKNSHWKFWVSLQRCCSNLPNHQNIPEDQHLESTDQYLQYLVVCVHVLYCDCGTSDKQFEDLSENDSILTKRMWCNPQCRGNTLFNTVERISGIYNASYPAGARMSSWGRSLRTIRFRLDTRRTEPQTL